MATLREQMQAKYGGGGTPASSTTPSKPGSGAEGNSARQRLVEKYTARSAPIQSTPLQQAPAPTPVQSGGPFGLSFGTLDIGRTANSTPQMIGKEQGTLEVAKTITRGLLSIPSTLWQQQANPDEWQKEFERQAYPEASNPALRVIQAPIRTASKAVSRFINPTLRPLGEDISSAIALGGFGGDPIGMLDAIETGKIQWSNAPQRQAAFDAGDQAAYDAVPDDVQTLFPAINKSMKQVIGDTAQAVLTAYSPTLVGRTAVKVSGAPVRSALLTGARVGGEAGAFFGVAQVMSEDLKDPTQIAQVMFANIAGGAIIGGIISGAVPIARADWSGVTKTVIEQYKMPPSIYIDARKVKDIFQTGNIISPQESAMIQSLGLDGSQYRQAIKNGVTIQMPGERLVQIVDKPWFGKIKSAIGIKPSNPNIRVETVEGNFSYGKNGDAMGFRAQGDTSTMLEGRIRQSEGMDVDAAIDAGDIPEASVYADRGKQVLAPEYAAGRIDDVAQKLESYWPGLGDKYRKNVKPTGMTMDGLEQAGVDVLRLSLERTGPDGAMLALPDGQAKAVARAVSTPVTAGLLKQLSMFDEPQQAAFGRKVVESINEELGTNITKGELPIPDNIRVLEQPSVDGRPAQYNGREDRIELFLPDLMRDLGDLARGKSILIHPNSPFTEVIRLKDGESIQEIITRYVKEVVLHEAAHQQTPDSLESKQEVQKLQAEITQARLDQNTAALNDAQTRMDKLQMDVENRANAYLKENRAALEKEVFAKRGIEGDYTFDVQERGGAYAAVYTSGPSTGEVAVTASTRPALLRKVVQQNREGGISLDMRAYQQEVVAVKAPNRFEKRALRIEDDAPVKMTEKQALTARVRARAQGSREGYVAGKREATETVKAEAKSRYDSTMERISDRAASIAERKKALIEYSRLLAYRDRGKFLKAINNVKTDKDMAGVLDRMRKAANLTDRRNLIVEIQKELKATKVKTKDGLPNAKFAYDQQKFLNEVRAVQARLETEAKNLRAAGNDDATAYGLAQQQIVERIADWQTKNPDGAFPYENMREVEILKLVGLKDMTAQELRAALGAIQSVKETGRTQKELERFNRDTEVQRIKDGVMEVVTGGEALPSEGNSIKRREELERNWFKTYARDSIFAWEELLDKLSVKDKGSKPYESFLSRWADRNSSRAFNAQNKGELTQIRSMQEILTEAYGEKGKRQTLSFINELQEQAPLGEIMHTDGKKRALTLSRGEAMQYYAWHQDEALDKTFTESMFWGEDVWDAIDGLLTPEDKRAVELGLAHYNAYYDRVNPVFVADYGIDLPFNENYSPIRRDVDVIIPENVLLAQESAAYASAKNGNLKARQKSVIELKPTDFFENMSRHAQRMEHYVAWSKPMYEFRRVFGDKQFRQAIADIHGTPYLRILDNFLNDFARDGVSREKVHEFADAFRKNSTVAMLGLNIKSAIKQIPGVLNYGIELPLTDLTTGISDFWTSPQKHARFLYDNSDTLQERFGTGFERDIAYAIERGYEKQLAGARNFAETMFIPMRNADKLTVYMGSWASFQSRFKELNGGKPFRFGDDVSEDMVREAIEYAERVTNRTQESSRLDTLAPLQRAGSFAKLFTQFQGQPSKYIRIMSNAARNYKAGRQSGFTASKRIAWAWFVAPFFWNLLNDYFKKDEYKEGLEGVALRTLFGPLTYWLILGQVAQSAYGWTQGESFEYGIPSFAFAGDIQKAIQNFTAGDIVDGITYVLDAAGKIKGVPTNIGGWPGPEIGTRMMRDVMKEDEDEGGGRTVTF